MGMFDYVRYSAPCYKCGHTLNEWQSKDHDCSLDTVEPTQVSRFYTACPKCRAWNEYKVEPPKEATITPNHQERFPL